MGDEMSVTVIATGFDKERVPLSANAVGKILGSDPFAKPATEVKPVAQPDGLDVPTFLRNKKKIIDTSNF